MTSNSQLHWTYALPDGDLQQGDVVLAGEDLTRALRDHLRIDAASLPPHVVLTQSCDLVRRAAPCKAEHVVLAHAVPLPEFLSTRIRALQRDADQRRWRVCSEKRRATFLQLIERVLRNNEQAIFYFHEEPKLKLHSSMVALLGQPIVVPVEPFYDMLLVDRVARLSPEFQAKLGSLVGQQYSRIATIDWDEVEGAESMTGRISALADSVAVAWAPDRVIKELGRREKNEKRELSQEEVLSMIEDEAKKQATKRQQTLEAIVEAMRNVGQDDDVIRSVIDELNRNQEFSKIFR